MKASIHAPDSKRPAPDTSVLGGGGEAEPALISKRSFLKGGLSTAAIGLISQYVPTPQACASPTVLPAGFLESRTHRYWMRLSYGRGSRQVRRQIGAGLRNIGAIKGRGAGAAFAKLFDASVEKAFLEWVEGIEAPGEALYALIQHLHDNFIQPAGGINASRIFFGTLFFMVRGLNGNLEGEDAYQAYKRYRDATKHYKNIANPELYPDMDPGQIKEARTVRSTLLQQWKGKFIELVEGHAQREFQLNPSFIPTNDMTIGFHVYNPPTDPSEWRLRLRRSPDNPDKIIGDWNGDGLLQRSDNLREWKETSKPSPNQFDISEKQRGFFRLKRRRRK